MRFQWKRPGQDQEENREAILDSILLINQQRLFLASLIGIPVVLLHVFFFWIYVSPKTPKEELWRIGVIGAHSFLFFWFLLLIFLTAKSRKATDTAWWMTAAKDLYILVLFVASIALVSVDQWVTPNITPLINASLISSIFFLIRPVKSILYFLSSYFLYYYMIGLTQTDPALLASNRVNGLSIIAIGIGLSIILWRVNYKNIQQQMIIEQQTHDLRVTAARQKTIASLSSDFINAHIENIDEKIHSLLQECGDLFQVEWTFLFQFSSDGTTLSNTHEWSQNRDLSLKERIQKCPLALAPYFSSYFQDHQMIFIPSIEDLPKEADLEKERFKEQGVESALYLPLLKDDELKGYFGFKSAKRRDLTNDELEILQIIGNILADALAKNTMEKEILEAKDKAQRANAAKSQFLANMSHELRTPLNAIIGFTELTQKTSLTPNQRDNIKKISLASENLLRIINDILDASKMESEMLILEEVNFYLLDVLYKVSDILASSISKKGLSFYITLEREAPKAFLGDPFRLEQILLNIVSNSVKFTDQGGEILLHISWLEDSGDRSQLLFSVKDTGIGIAKDQQSLLFQPFVQADGTSTRQFGGTGLGLTISKSLVEMMNGEMMVESELGEGSHFFFTIQLERAKKPLCPSNFLLPKRYEKTKLLLLEEGSSKMALLREMLLSFGFHVESISSIEGIEMERIQGEPIKGVPSLVLLHEEREKPSNYETLRDSLPAHAPMISILVGQAPLLYDKKSVDTFIDQPINPSLIFEALEEVLMREDQELLPPPSTEIPDLSGARVLLAEDTPLNQELVRSILEDVGIEVVIVATGEEALKEALSYKEEKPYPYDAILMDLQMPLMDGFEVTERIRQEETLKSVPIIALTAHAMASDREKGLALGMNDYLTKPIHSHDLYMALLRNIKQDKRPSLAQLHHFPEEKNAYRMPEIPGLHVKEALKRLNNREDLYLRLLQSFLQENEGILEALKEALVLGDREILYQRIHTLKGSLGSIGAYELQEEALGLEGLIGEIGEGEELNFNFHRFEAQFSLLMASLNDHVKGEWGEAEGLPSKGREEGKDLQESLEELDTMLAMGRFEAIESFKRLKELLGEIEVREELIALERHIKVFAMKEARQVLQQLAAKLHFSIKEERPS